MNPHNAPGYGATGEQQAALDAFATGGHLTLQAGAGSGKTTTLRMLAESAPKQRGVYIAFNKAIATDAQKSFPGTVECRTAHSFAYAAVGRNYRHRLNGPRISGQQNAKLLGINEPLLLDSERMLQPKQLARVALETVQRYCWSADTDIQRRHVPLVTGVDTQPERDALAGLVLPYARKAWVDLTSHDGRLRFNHDVYLKLWQLKEPALNADYVLLDEAQDANPVIAAVFGAQQAQKVVVGDTCQAIYAWRGAVDALQAFPSDHVLYLSQSFRFGPAIAHEANKWLTYLDAPLRITGMPTLASRVAELDDPDAVLCRTNAKAVGVLLDYQATGVPAAIVGGGADVKWLAEAAITLQDGKGTSHPELCAFQTWGQVQDYVDQDHGGEDLKVLVRLVDKYGADTIAAAIDRAVPEHRAAVVVSTAHKAKGREWGQVRIATDFPNRKDRDGNLTATPDEDKRLAYVAVTRARQALDRTGLAWIDSRLEPSAEVVDKQTTMPEGRE